MVFFANFVGFFGFLSIYFSKALIQAKYGFIFLCWLINLLQIYYIYSKNHFLGLVSFFFLYFYTFIIHLSLFKGFCVILSFCISFIFCYFFIFSKNHFFIFVIFRFQKHQKIIVLKHKKIEVKFTSISIYSNNFITSFLLLLLL